MDTPFGNRLPYNQNVRPVSATYGARERGRGRGICRGRAQSIPEPSIPDKNITHSQFRQQAVTEVAGNKNSSETKQSSDELNTLCDFCGDSIDTAVLVHINNKVYHKNCIRTRIPYIDKAVGIFRKFINPKTHILRVGINVSFLYGQKEPDKYKKTKRAIKLVELLNNASALLNSGSGFIFIHLVGLAPGDNFTGAFDEFADAKLNELINDGSAFGDVFKKQLLSEHSRQELQVFNDILVLTVDAAEFLVTSDTKTKTALDSGIIDTQDQTLLKFLQKSRQFNHQYHKLHIETPDDLNRLQECRDIQAKDFFQSAISVDNVVRLFDKLKLAECVSAFSKHECGGSYLLGMAEESYDPTTESVTYKSKRLYSKPIAICDCTEVETQIKRLLEQTVLVCDYSGEKQSNGDLIQIKFIPVRPTRQESPTTSGYIVHISVRSVSGVVFYDKDGPVAYRIDRISHCITRIPVDQWFQAFRQRIGTPH